MNTQKYIIAGFIGKAKNLKQDNIIILGTVTKEESEVQSHDTK